MAIADLATASAEVNGASLTFAHTVAGSADLVLWVAVDSFRGGGSSDPTGVTYAGAALTKIATFLGGGGNDNAVSLWRKIGPATGTNNVVVTHSAAHDITALSYSRSGVDQTTPNDAVVALDDAADQDPTHAITSATGDLVVSFLLGWDWVTLGEDGDLTIQLANSNGSGLNSIAVGDAPGAASVNASWTTGSYSDPHGLFSFNVNAASSGFTGTAAGTLAPATSSASGSALLAITGTVARSLTPATGAAAGSSLLAITGTAARTLTPVTGAAAGTHTAGGFTGTVAGATAPATSAATGLEVFQGTVARTLTPATGQATGSALLAVVGAGAGTLAPAAGAAAGAEAFAGAAAGTLAPATGAATGTQGAMVFAGAAAGTLAALRGRARGFAPVVALALGLPAPAPAGAALAAVPFGPLAPAALAAVGPPAPVGLAAIGGPPAPVALAAASKSDPAELAA